MEPRKDYNALIEEFKAELENRNFISNLTGQILTDPIRIPGSGDLVEREFIRRSIQSSGKNPFTREQMTLEMLEKIPTDKNAKETIENLIAEFLSKNKDILIIIKFMTHLREKYINPPVYLLKLLQLRPEVLLIQQQMIWLLSRMHFVAIP